MAFSDVLTKPKTTQSTGFGSVKKASTKSDLGTTAGLQTYAEQQGLGPEAQRVLASKGEQPKQIFSGGVVNDIFDFLNVLDYGVVGVLKGKSFSEGVKTRASFTDKDALGDKGIPGMIAGIALDIAVDPLTYINPAQAITKISKATGLAKPAEKVASVVSKSRFGQQLGRLFVYRFGQDLVYKNLAERSLKNTQVGIQNMIDIVKPITSLDPQVQKRLAEARKSGELAEYFSGSATKITKNFRVSEQAAKMTDDDLLLAIGEFGPEFNKLNEVGKLDVDALTFLGDMERKLIKSEKLTGGQRQALVELLSSKGLGGEIPVAITTKGAAAAPKGLTADILQKARPAFDELDRLGKEAVDVGLLPKDVYDANVGTYMARLYRKHEIPGGIVDKIKTSFDIKPTRIDLSRFKKRTDIPEDVREAMGEILEAGYPTAKSLVQLKQAVERAKFFKEVSGKWAKDAAEEGFEKLSDTKRLGDLANKFVPKPIADDINEIIRQKTTLQKNLGKAVAGFKFGKVILNPATHARNIMSNFVLNNFEGLSPARLDIYGTAAKELTTKGKWYQEAKQVGLGLDTFASKEIKEMLTGPESVGLVRRYGRNFADQISGLYQKEEEFAKLAQYIYKRKKGLSPENAWKAAETATFNYAQVTPFVRRLRESIFGYPFITFTYKATPQVIKTAATKPTKISNIGKIKNAIENQSDLKELQRERASEPDWVRDGFYIKLPMKDKYGRSAYLDMSYILPFGDLVSGQFFERGIKRETGLPEGLVEAQVKKLPFPNLVRELAKNQDFFGNKVFRESDPTEKQLGDVMRHIIKSYAPPLVADQIPGGYRASGTRRPGSLKRALNAPVEAEQGGFQTRDLQQELLKMVGLKVSPIDIQLQEHFADQERERALTTLLKERGLLSEFSKPFVTKK